MSILSEIAASETQLAEKSLLSDNGKAIIIDQQPIMECALDVLTNLGNFGQVILKAKGDSIPIAVAVANIVTEKMMKGNSAILDIIVDSENAKGKYGMTLVSTIQIIIAKKTA